MTWLDALFGRLFSKGVPVDLAGGLNFTDGLKASYNQSTNRNDVSIDGLQTAPYSIDDAGASLTVDETGAAVAWIASPFVTPEQFGAIGDGLNNDAVALQAALNAAASRGVELLISRRHEVAAVLEIPSGVVIRGVSDTAELLHVRLRCQGTWGAELALLAASVEGATTLSVDTTTLAAGDWIRVASCINANSADAGVWQLGDLAADDSYLAEFAQIKTVDSSTQVTLHKPLRFPYSNTPGSDTLLAYTTSVVRKVTFHEECQIRDLSLTGREHGTAAYILIATLCRGLTLSHVTIDTEAECFATFHTYCLDCTTEGGSLIGQTPAAVDAGANIAKYTSCQNCKLIDVSLYNGYQGVDFSHPTDDAYRGGPSLHCSAVACYAERQSAEGFVDHEGSYGTRFTQCTTVGHLKAIKIRSRGAVVSNCTMHGLVQAGSEAAVFVHKAALDAIVEGCKIYGHPNGIVYALESAYVTLASVLQTSARFTGNEIAGTSARGVILSNVVANAGIYGPAISNNTISNPGFDGIYIGTYNNGTKVSGNVVRGLKLNQAGVFLSLNVVQTTIENNEFEGGASSRGIEGGGSAAMITDTTTFPGGNAEAALIMRGNRNNAASPIHNLYQGFETLQVLPRDLGMFHGTIVDRSSAVISSDTITWTSGVMTIDTEAAAASDNLATILGGINGLELELTIVSGSRTVTLVETGNIRVAGGTSLTLDGIFQCVKLRYYSTYWLVTSNEGGTYA